MFRARVIVPVLALALAAACGGEAKETPTSAAPSASSSAAASSASPTTDVVEIKVTVSGGKVAPRPSIHKIKKGQTVRIIVTSDKADEVHVHGYEKEKELAAGETGTIEFTADETGRFEVETHHQGLQLFQFEVS